MTEESTGDLCRCCHSEGSFQSLYTPYKKIETVNSNKKTEVKKEDKFDEEFVYSDVLRECFNIELLAMRESLQHVLFAICYTCIKRLEDAVKFKQQIEKCEKRFREVYFGFVNKDSTEVTIKKEPLEFNENIVLEVSFDNGARDDSNEVPDDGNCADDNKDMDLHLDDEDNSLHNNVVNSEETTTTPDNVNKEKLEKRPKPVQDKEVLKVIKGIKVVKKRNIVRRHIHYEETDGLFKCLKCPRTANSDNAIRTHVRYCHFNVPKYKCRVCSQPFATLTSFNEHKLGEHNIDDRFKCDACDNTFHTKIQLKWHKNSYHKLGTEMKCKLCEFVCYDKWRLSHHMRRHSNERKYKCSYCTKAFKIRDTMRMHERIHTGEKRKLCAECGQAFVQRSSLTYHMIKHHPGVKF